MDKNDEIYKKWSALKEQSREINKQIKLLKQEDAALDKQILEIEDKYKRTRIVRVYAECCMEIGIPSLNDEDAIEVAKYECGNWSFSEWDGFASGPIRAEVVCDEADYDEKTMRVGTKWLDGSEDDDK